jgi:predicted site-specific integrase-resolvase
MTPNQLADELGISPKTLRAWLRETHPRPSRLKWSHWVLGPGIVQAARARWA